ncbi:MAG: hypothetical protein KBA75_04555 [Alphaproteobacteria bacterium]|nr:hypothetical protein [Alphaproteobacteria bacterium]
MHTPPNPFAAVKAPHAYTVRDRVAVSDQASVLTAPDSDRSLNLALWTTSLDPAVRQFFALKTWQASCFQLFKPLLAQHTYPESSTSNAIKLSFNEKGFFPVLAESAGQPRVVDGQRNYSVNHSRGDTHFLLMGDFWKDFARKSATPAHPLLQHITRRREKIKATFGVAKVDVELRFESAQFGAPTGVWHSDADRSRLIGTLTGSETEFLREPFVLRDRTRAMMAQQAKGANSTSMKTKLVLAARDLLGPRFDYTRMIATNTAQVETIARGHLGRIIGVQRVKEGASECSLLHRRPRVWLQDRVVEMYYPHVSS